MLAAMFLFQPEDGKRDVGRSRRVRDVYKGPSLYIGVYLTWQVEVVEPEWGLVAKLYSGGNRTCIVVGIEPV